MTYWRPIAAVIFMANACTFFKTSALELRNCTLDIVNLDIINLKIFKFSLLLNIAIKFYYLTYQLCKPSQFIITQFIIIILIITIINLI